MPRARDASRSRWPTSTSPGRTRQEWAAAVARSPLLAAGVVHWEHGLVYLDRYHEQETQVLADLQSRQGNVGVVDTDLLEQSLARVFPDSPADEQREACRRAASQATTVITGGPGTGKTTAVAGLLVALVEQAEARGEVLRIALAAPTGKAAARLEQSVRDSATRFSPQDQERLAGIRAMTCTACCASIPATARASATTAATDCRTTSSWSTRHRWSRSR